MSAENYTWNYLNSPQANPMFEEIAKFVKLNNCKNLLDLGCGYSRVNEFLTDYDYNISGVDTDAGCINYCKDTYNANSYTVGDVTKLEHIDSIVNTPIDCIILSGIVYYFGAEKNNMPVEDYVDYLIKLFNPKIIVMAEPRPSVAYISPDYSELFDRYAYVAKNHSLDIRMGNRIVYCLYVDKTRPERKIKASFNENSIHQHHKQDDFDNNRLRHNVYMTNTENLSHERDGLLFPANPENQTYICVAAGFKGMYKAAIDWYPGKQYEFVYVDVVPTALDYRMFMDSFITKQYVDGNDMFNTIYDVYKKDINPSIIPLFGSGDSDIDTTVKNQVNELGISEVWPAFLESYKYATKTYIKLDAVNNVKLLARLLNQITSNDNKKWFWYSNMFDWHQFRFKEQTFNNWKHYVESQVKDIELSGHTPPFTTS